MSQNLSILGDRQTGQDVRSQNGAHLDSPSSNLGLGFRVMVVFFSGDVDRRWIFEIFSRFFELWWCEGGGAIGCEGEVGIV